MVSVIVVCGREDMGQLHGDGDCSDWLRGDSGGDIGQKATIIAPKQPKPAPQPAEAPSFLAKKMSAQGDQAQQVCKLAVLYFHKVVELDHEIACLKAQRGGDRKYIQTNMVTKVMTMHFKCGQRHNQRVEPAPCQQGDMLITDAVHGCRPLRRLGP